MISINETINHSAPTKYSSIKVIVKNYECNICYDVFDKSQIVKLNCNHDFCKNCVKSTIKSCIEMNKEACCPYCRESINEVITTQREIQQEIQTIIQTETQQNNQRNTFIYYF
jgi:hypothetical protein